MITLWVLGGGAAGTVLIFIARWIDAAYMGSRWGRGVTRLGRELGGNEQDPVSWLDAVWAGHTPRGLDGRGMYHRVIVLRERDYPIMIYASTSSVVLLLAAWIPDVSDRHDNAPISTVWVDSVHAVAILSELEASDFNVTVARAGLVATVCRNSMSEFRSHPDRLVALAPAVRRMADLAVAMNAQHIDKALFGSTDSSGESDASVTSRDGEA